MIRRRPLTPGQKAAVLKRQDFKCPDCDTEYGGAIPFEDDHWLPLHLGGGNELANRVMRCRPCHRKKSNGENTERAKADRRAAKLGPITTAPRQRMAVVPKAVRKAMERANG